MPQQKKAKNLVFLIAGLVLLAACQPTIRKLKRDAVELDSLHQYKEAINLYTAILARDPNDIDAYFDRAMDKSRLEDHEGSIADFREIVKLDSANTLSFYNLGVEYGIMKKYEESIYHFNTALRLKKIDPSQTKSTNILLTEEGSSLIDEGPYDCPVGQILFGRGRIYYKSDSIRKAYFDFSNCIGVDYRRGESYFMRGLCYLSSGMKEDACKDLNLGYRYGATVALKAIAENCQ